jgi:hypothetical protein
VSVQVPGQVQHRVLLLRPALAQDLRKPHFCLGAIFWARYSGRGISVLRPKTLNLRR